MIYLAPLDIFRSMWFIFITIMCVGGEGVSSVGRARDFW